MAANGGVESGAEVRPRVEEERRDTISTEKKKHAQQGAPAEVHRRT
jgi:hypothetical protein